MSQVTVKTDIPQTVNYQSCTVQAGTTTTLQPGRDATVTNAGTEYNAVLNFGIPRGKSAYEQAVEGGYQGAEEEFEQALASDIATVADNISDINAVGQSITEVNAVADNLTDVSTVADNVSDVNTVAGISSDVSQVAGISSAVQTVSSHDSEVTLVSDNMASVMTTASNISNVNAVAGNATNINTVAGISSDVTTVSTNATAVTTAATNMAAIIAAPTAAQNAANSATNAQKWAEGTDSDVTPLGGTHSSKGWANVAKQYAESIGAALKYKGSVSTYSALPSTGQEIGDMWNVLDTGKNYAWTGTEWDDLSGVVDLSAYRTAAAQDVIDSGKQATLVSGTNIKTVNGNSLLGSGNVDALPSQSGNSGKFLTTNGTDASWATVNALPAQSGQSGKFLTTNGSAASWANVDALPTQTGQQGKYLTTNGTTASWDIPMAGLPMFYATYQPRKLNNASWLRADPYSWHSADVYVSAYAHLADNISGVTAETETIAGTTITFYQLSDEIKVVLPDQETNLDAIYNATGIGYYFVLDTTNRQFKLPRNIYGFTGYRGDVGGYVAPGLPNITGDVVCLRNSHSVDFANGAFYNSQKSTSSNGTGSDATTIVSVAMDASRSSAIYGNSTTVQPPATQAYLYFYVGNTVQNETSVDVAEMTEAINNKLDIDVSNATADAKNTITGWCKPSNRYIDLTLGASSTWYQAPANGMFSLRRIASNYDGTMVGVYSSDGTTSGSSVLQYAISTETNDLMLLNIPVKKGQYIRIDYVSITTDILSYFRFIYDEGAN